LFQNPGVKLVALNVQAFDAGKRGALPLVGDAKAGLAELDARLSDWSAPSAWASEAKSGKAKWQEAAGAATAASNAALPSDAQVIGAVQRVFGTGATVVCAAGGLPGELHKLWQAGAPGSYHLEYGYSTMGYEIAGGLGVKLARPKDEVVVMIGDGSYMMMNSELATAVMLGAKLTVVVLDNRGFGCINRLQMATGGASFNNLFTDAKHEVLPEIDFRKHAEAMGAVATKAVSIAELETALVEAKTNDRTTLIVIETHPLVATGAGGHWWDVAVPEVSEREEVRQARKAYEEAVRQQRVS
jgi:3D-(3,5/4)-trihydroxycyclohexane-1,2-dione acylhydrolase (decyclizing)